MAEKKTPSKNKSNHEKRMAQSAPKSSAEKEARLSKEREEREKYKKKQELAARSKKIAAVVFSVIFILAFAIPSAALMLSNNSSSTDSTYESAIEGYQQQLDENPSDLTQYLNMADLYYDWAYAVMTGEKTSSREYKDLFSEAVANYSSYLAENTDSEASINQASAYFYSGDNASAIDVLTKCAQSDPDNALVYARLGTVYYQDGQNDLARENYNKAVELDPDDEKGAKSEAQNMLTVLDASSSSDSTESSN